MAAVQANEESQAASAAVQQKKTSFVRSNDLNTNDVLLGRGTGPREYSGNVRFRELIKERKTEYTSRTHYKPKAQIANQVLQKVHASGGRFLKLVPAKSGTTTQGHAVVDQATNDNHNEDDDDDDDEELWMVVDTAAALEKCKQALREQTKKRKNQTAQADSPANALAPAAAVGRDVATPTQTLLPTTTPSGPGPIPLHNQVGLQRPPSLSPPRIMSVVPSSMLLGRQKANDDIHTTTTTTSTPISHYQSGYPPHSFMAAAPPMDARLCLFQSMQQQQQPFSPSEQPNAAATLASSQQTDEASSARFRLFKDILYSRYLEAVAVGNTTTQPIPPPSRLASPRNNNHHHQEQREKSPFQRVHNAEDLASASDDSQSKVKDESTIRGNDPRNDNNVGDICHNEQCKSNTSYTSTDTKTTTPSKNNSSSDSEEEIAAVALSVLSVADRPRFTQEQEELERASMTDEERASVLADIFGKLCIGNRQKAKKARRDLDQRSINFLIQRMKHEIDIIPKAQKKALLEARERAQPQEFSSERLERFLRCDGMNAKMAAQRFISYWEGRRQVFGPQKFVQRMTLSEALRDDVAAIQAGAYCLLPHPDLSGRQLLYLEPHRSTKQGCTSESMVRAFWYTMEVTSQENSDIGSGIVHIINDRHSTIADFDRNLFEPFIRLMTYSWPIKSTAIHACCAPSLLLRVMKPVLFALTHKSARSRVVVHDTPEAVQLISELEQFGIVQSMLPSDLGGSIRIDQSEWITQRRAVEMEEL